MSETSEPVEAVEVNWMGRARTIAAWRIRDNLIDCGPTTALPGLLQALGDWRPRRLILTHIHFDHAGAAGVLGPRRADPEGYRPRRGAKDTGDPEGRGGRAGPALARPGGLRPRARRQAHGRSRAAGGERAPGVRRRVRRAFRRP